MVRCSKEQSATSSTVSERYRGPENVWFGDRDDRGRDTEMINRSVDGRCTIQLNDGGQRQAAAANAEQPKVNNFGKARRGRLAVMSPSFVPSSRLSGFPFLCGP